MPDLDVYRCGLCWATFDGPGDLAAHEQEEHEHLYPVDDGGDDA